MTKINFFCFEVAISGISSQQQESWPILEIDTGSGAQIVAVSEYLFQKPLEFFLLEEYGKDCRNTIRGSLKCCEIALDGDIGQGSEDQNTDRNTDNKSHFYEISNGNEVCIGS